MVGRVPQKGYQRLGRAIVELQGSPRVESIFERTDPHDAPLSVCYFGTYETDYPGNRVLIEGLRQNGVQVYECHVPLWEKTRNKTAAYFRPASVLILGLRYLVCCALLLFKLRQVPSFDVIIVGFNGHLDVICAKLVAVLRARPLVANPMLSMYDTLVVDKAFVKQGGLYARLILALERLLFKLPDAIFLDAEEHFSFFNRRLGCPWSKFKQLFFGADDRVFFPRPSNNKDASVFTVLFYGKFQPLQGVPIIVRAAKLLEPYKHIRLRIIGSGPDSQQVNELASQLHLMNVEFIEWVDFEDLQSHIADADVCLGIFGTTEKVHRCIANKVVQALAMAKPVITGNCAATREFLTDGEHALLCDLGSPEALAQAILRLENDPALRARLARNGYELFVQQCSTKAVGRRAKLHLLSVCRDYQMRRERGRDSAIQAFHR